MSITEDYTTEEELEDFSRYLEIALAEYHGGFSKGTANVSQADVKKLHGLLDYYRKKPHPFRACVADNKKRFGANVNQYCAVLKDLIVGNTNWRNQKKKNLSETELNETYKLDYVPEGFLHALSEWDGEISSLETEDLDEINLAAVIWDKNESFDTLRFKVEEALNSHPPGHPEYESDNSGLVDSESSFYGHTYWVRDITANKALVCAGGDDYFVVNFSVDKNGDVTVADETKWTPVAQEWVKQNETYLSDDNIVAEVFLSDSGMELGEDGLIYKTVAREGTWKFSPGPGQRPVNKPLTFVREGKSDPDNLLVSLEELKANFDNGVIDHVTVPLSHADKVEENTGYIRNLTIKENEEGIAELVAGIEFTEPDIKEKVLRGTIANISSGLNFDYIKKDIGKKFRAVLGHAALTNKPWLNGMPKFSTSLGEPSEILAFSEQENFNAASVIEEENQTTPRKGGSEVEVENTNEVEAPAPTFLSELGLSEDVAKSMLEEYKSLKAEQKKSRVDEQARKWQSEGKTPALIKAAESILLADEGVVVLNLSEEGEEQALTASDIVRKLMEAAPTVNLSEDVLKDEELQGKAPAANADEENAKAELSLSERAAVTQLMFEQNYKEADAIAEVKRQTGSK